MWAAFLLLLWTFAPPAAAEDDTAVWNAQFVTVNLHPDATRGVSLWLDAHQRHTANGFVGIVRPAVGYDLSKGLAVWAGYGWIPTVPTDGTLHHEHRIYEQVTGSGKVAPLLLSGRARLEQRFVQDGDRVGLRLRLLGRAGLPIGEQGYGVFVSDELFLALNATSFATTGFDQNRLMIGPYLQTEKKIRFEFGYLQVALRKAGDTRIFHGTILSVTLPLKVKRASEPG